MAKAPWHRGRAGIVKISVNERMATRRVQDDSDEEEATALDLRPQSRSAARPDPSAPRPQPPAKAHRPIVADDSSEDEEATEFLQARPSSARSTSADAVPRGQGRAVPIEVVDGPSPSPLSAAPLPLPASPLPAPTPSLSTLPEPIVRPLPQRTIGADISSTGTASAPRVTRIQMIRDLSSTRGSDDGNGAETAGDEDITIPPEQKIMAPKAPPPRVSTKVDNHVDETQALNDPDETQAPSEQAPPETHTTSTSTKATPEMTTSPEVLQVSTQPPESDDDQDAADVVEPAPRGLPNTAEGEPIPARAKRPAPRPVEKHEDLDGVLVIDAPAEATVTVNGVERGRGLVKVAELDRHAKHAVRIHCSGYAPWSGSVTLQGKAAAKIRPTLKPRR